MRKGLKHGQEEQTSRASPASGVWERAEGSKAKTKAMEDAFSVSSPMTIAVKALIDKFNAEQVSEPPEDGGP
jgi:hypothetical protein